MKTWLLEPKGKRNMLRKIRLIWTLIRKKTIIGKKPKPESGTIGRTKTKKEPVIGIRASDDLYTFIYIYIIMINPFIN
jgi:hypothetical protein